MQETNCTIAGELRTVSGCANFLARQRSSLCIGLPATSVCPASTGRTFWRRVAKEVILSHTCARQSNELRFRGAVQSGVSSGGASGQLHMLRARHRRSRWAVPKSGMHPERSSCLAHVRVASSNIKGGFTRCRCARRGLQWASAHFYALNSGVSGARGCWLAILNSPESHIHPLLARGWAE